MSRKIHATEIEDLEKFSNPNKIWYPDTPRVRASAYNPSTYKTTLAVFKKDPSKNLYYKHPNTGELTICNQLDIMRTFVLSARNVTNPFGVLIYYNFRDNVIGIREGTPAAIPEIPLIDEEIEIKIDEHIEVAQGESAITPPTPSDPDINKLLDGKLIAVNAGSIQLDFDYGTNYIDDFSASITAQTFIGTLKRGKVLKLEIPGHATRTLTWGSKFKESSQSATPSTVSTTLNIYAITVRRVTSGSELFTVRCTDNVPNAV